MRVNFFVVFAICAMLLIAGCAAKPKEAGKNETTAPASAPPPSGEAKPAEGKGKLVVAVTDEEPPADVHIVATLDVTIVNKETGEEVVLAENKEIDLTNAAGIAAALGEEEVTDGTWELQVHFDEVHYENEQGETTGTATVADSEVTVGTVSVEEGKTSVATIDFHGDSLYTEDTSKPVEPVTTTVVVEAEPDAVSTEPVVEDGQALDIVLIDKGTLESTTETTLTATGQVKTETQSAPTETSVETTVNDNGAIVTTVTEVTATGVEVSTFTSTDVQSAFQTAATETGLSTKDAAKLTDFTHEESRTLEKQSLESAEKAAELLATTTEDISEKQQAEFKEKALTATERVLEVIEDIPSLSDEQQTKLIEVMQEVKTTIEQGGDTDAAFAKADAVFATLPPAAKIQLEAEAKVVEDNVGEQQAAAQNVELPPTVIAEIAALTDESNQQLEQADQKLDAVIPAQLESSIKVGTVQELQTAEAYISEVTQVVTNTELLGSVDVAVATSEALTTAPALDIPPESVPEVVDTFSEQDYHNSLSSINEAEAAERITSEEAAVMRGDLDRVREEFGTDQNKEFNPEEHTQFLVDSRVLEEANNDNFVEEKTYEEFIAENPELESHVTKEEFEEFKDDYDGTEEIPAYDELPTDMKQEITEEEYVEAAALHAAVVEKSLEEVASEIASDYKIDSVEDLNAVTEGNAIPVPTQEDFEKLYPELAKEVSEKEFESQVGHAVSGLPIKGEADSIPGPGYYAPPAGLVEATDSSGNTVFIPTVITTGTEYSLSSDLSTVTTTDGKEYKLAIPEGKPASKEGEETEVTPQYAFTPPAYIKEGKVSYLNIYEGGSEKPGALHEYNFETGINEVKYSDEKLGSYDISVGKGMPLIGGTPLVVEKEFTPPVGWTPPKVEVTFVSGTGETFVYNPQTGSAIGDDGSVLSSTGQFYGDNKPEGYDYVTPPDGLKLPPVFVPPTDWTPPEGFTPPPGFIPPSGFDAPEGFVEPAHGYGFVPSDLGAPPSGYYTPPEGSAYPTAPEGVEIIPPEGSYVAPPPEGFTPPPGYVPPGGEYTAPPPGSGAPPPPGDGGGTPPPGDAPVVTAPTAPLKWTCTPVLSSWSDGRYTQTSCSWVSASYSLGEVR